MRNLAMAFCLWIFALPAAGQEPVRHDADRPEPVGEESGEPDLGVSPIRWMWDLRGGLFLPEIDSEFGGAATPYADIFGNDQKMAWRTELSWQFYRGIGSLGVGTDLGLFYRSGKALLEDGTKSGDGTSFVLIPMGLKLVYRFDWLQTTYHFPLTPYGKAGLVYNFWWITDGDGSVATWGTGDGGGKARGGTYGWEVALGLSLLLDFFDSDSAANLERESGINNSYIFVEWMYNKSDNFGEDGALRVGGAAWMFGLGVEF